MTRKWFWLFTVLSVLNGSCTSSESATEYVEGENVDNMAEGDEFIEEGAPMEGEEGEVLAHASSPVSIDGLRTFVEGSREQYTPEEIQTDMDKILSLYRPMVQPEPSAVSEVESFLQEGGALKAHWIFYELAYDMLAKLDETKGNPAQSRENLIIYTNSLKLVADHQDAKSTDGTTVYLNLAKELYKDTMETYFQHKF